MGCAGRGQGDHVRIAFKGSGRCLTCLTWNLLTCQQGGKPHLSRFSGHGPRAPPQERVGLVSECLTGPLPPLQRKQVPLYRLHHHNGGWWSCLCICRGSGRGADRTLRSGDEFVLVTTSSCKQVNGKKC